MVVFVRIDERLFHGQVCVKWVAYSKATDILIMDDAAANNALQKRIFMTMSAMGKKPNVVTVDEGIKLLTVGALSGSDRKVFVICGVPQAVLTMRQSGILFDQVNIGNMSQKKDRSLVYGFFFADATEREQLKQLAGYGVRLYYQQIPDGKSKEINNII